MRALPLLVLLSLHASVVGTSKPAQSLTAARIFDLPANQQNPWFAYLERSDAQQKIDRAALAGERRLLTGPVPPLPAESPSARSIPLDRDAAFYRSAAALHIANTILSFQIPSGGWSKNLDMAGPARLPGQSYTTDNLSRFLGDSPGSQPDFDAPRDPAWNYVGTLDNDATNAELRFLALISTAHPGHDGDRFRAGFLRGLRYLLTAQYPNGGWPQVWPLEGGYHDAVTFNDNALTESAALLHDVSTGAANYGFVPADIRTEAGTATRRAVDCILHTQVVVAGAPTAWAQQYDPLTLAPVAGRNFEPAALSAGESADVLIFLMTLDPPTPPIRVAVESGIAWLKAHAIYGQQWAGGRDTPPSAANPQGGRFLTAEPGAGPLWPRYIDLETGKPIFGDRDKSIHDNVMDLTLERRNGYAWYSAAPKAALDAYTVWHTKLDRP